METTKCPACGGLMRVRGSMLRVLPDKDEVWTQKLQCTICAHVTYRPFTQSEYAELLALKAANRRLG